MHIFSEHTRHKNAYEMGITSYLRNVKFALGSLFIKKIEIEISDGRFFD